MIGNGSSPRIFDLAFFFLIVISLSGCSRDLTSRRQRFLDSGQKYFDQGKYEAASIEFRRAVQLDGAFPESYLRLGTSLLKLQRWQEAYGSLQKAVALDPRNIPAQLQLADLELAAKRSSSARAHAQAALAADPRNSAAHISLGRIDLIEKKYNEALEEFKAAQEREPNQGPPLTYVGDTYVLLGRYDDAEQSFRKAIQIDPKLASTYIDLVQVYRIRNQPELEIATLRDGVQQNPAAIDLNLALATAYVRHGQADQVEPLFSVLRSSTKNSAAALLAIGQFYFRVGDVANAKTALTDALASEPSNDQVQKRLVEVYLSQHEWGKSEQLIRQLLKVNAKDPATRLLQARLQLAQGSRTDAINTLEQLAHDSPELPLPRFYLGLAYAGKGESARAISAFNETLELNPDFIWAYVSLGEIQNQQSNPKVALDVAKQALARNPGFLPAILLQANAYLQLGDNLAAERVLKDLSAVRSSNATILDQLARVELKRAKYADAERHLERALSVQPTYVPAMVSLVQLYQVTHRGDLTIGRVLTQLTQVPNEAALYELLGDLYLQRGDLQKAQQGFSRAADLNPNLTGAHLQLARTYQVENKLDEAVRTAEELVRLHPDLLSGYILLGDIYQQRGDLAKAEHVNEQALARNSDYAPALNNLAWLYCEHGGNLDMALGLAQKAKQQFPLDPRISDTLAWIEYRKGMFDAAAQSLKEVTTRFPENATYQYHYGMSLWKLSRDGDAKKALRRAVELSVPGSGAEEAKRALADLTAGPRAAVPPDSVRQQN